MKPRPSRRPIERLAPLSLLMALTACVPAAPSAPPNTAPETTATPDLAATAMVLAEPTEVGLL